MNGKVLIADEVATNRIALKAKLAAAAFQPIVATSGEECLRLVRQERPDLVILDANLTEPPTNQILQSLRENAETRDLPTMVLAANENEPQRKLMLSAGADEVFSKSVDDQLLQSRLRNLLRRRQEWADLAQNTEQGLFGMAEADVEFVRPGTIAIVTSRAEFGLKLRRALAGELRDECTVVTPHDALLDLTPERSAPDVYIIDGSAGPQDASLRLLSALRSRSSTRHSAVCLMCDPSSTVSRSIGFDLGADAVVGSQITAQELALRIRQQMRAKRRSDQHRERIQAGLRMAVIDPMTGLYNRRYAMARMATMVEQARSQQSSLAVMVADLDRFKSVNDRYGHRAGDIVLVEVARRFLDSLRAHDLLSRIGGEEFLIAIPGLQADGAMKVGNRLCNQIESRPFEVQPGVQLNVTLSVGVLIFEPATFRLPEFDVMPPEALSEHLIAFADGALMHSKISGRNRVSMAQSAA